MSTATKPKPQPAAAKDGMPSMIAYLTRALKTPTIGAFWEELAAQARDENWSHEEYLAALLQRQQVRHELQRQLDISKTELDTLPLPLSQSGL